MDVNCFYVPGFTELYTVVACVACVVAMIKMGDS